MRDGFSRREVVEGGLLLGLFTLAGCASASRSDDLPGPVAATGEPVKPPPVRRAPQRQSAPVANGPAPNVLPRSAWTSVGVANPGDINPMNGIQRITIHHDGMEAFTSTNQSECARRIELVRNSHVRGGRGNKAFADIGYHYVIDPAGRVWEARNIRYQGAHVQDNNENNLGICCLGNYDEQQPTPATKGSLDRFVAAQMKRYNVPLSRVKTHREINPTACPGRNMQAYMVATRGPSGQLRLAMADVAWAVA